MTDRGDAIEVVRETTDEPMPYHADSVFQYDRRILDELKGAADQHDEKRLLTAWKQAIPFRRSA